MKKLFLSLALLFCVQFVFGQNIEGAWNGQLEAGPQKLRMVVNISQQNSSYSGTMDSPDQGVKGIPLSAVTYSHPNISFSITQLGVLYNGEIQNDTTITGIFNQSGMAFPLKLVKGEIIPSRPQEPKTPYPYHSQDVKFKSHDPDAVLAGTLTLPQQGSGQYPAVILISGSGLQDRNEEIFGHKPFLVISDYLSRRGIAVLRYDDRGFGESSGDNLSATTDDFLKDALGAVDFLLSHPSIDNNKIGIIGHSEGGTIAFMAAAGNTKVSHIVTLAAMAAKGDDLLVKQNRDIMAAQGMTPAVVDTYCTALQRVFDIIKDTPAQQISENLNQIRSSLLTQREKEILPNALRDNLFAVLSTYELPSMRHFLLLDPAQYISNIKCPVYALNGSKDLQVDADDNLMIIEKNLVLAGNDDFATRKYDGLNHLFQNAKTGLITEYGQITETISPIVLHDIYKWISEKVELE